MAKPTRIVMNPAGWEALKLRVSQLVQQLTDDVYFDMIRFVPVDTGELRKSIKPKYPAWNRGRVVVATDHWQFPEYGTRYMSAEPYARPALYRYRHGVTL